jgi:hypothetical protein
VRALRMGRLRLGVVIGLVLSGCGGTTVTHDLTTGAAERDATTGLAGCLTREGLDVDEVTRSVGVRIGRPTEQATALEVGLHGSPSILLVVARSPAEQKVAEDVLGRGTIRVSESVYALVEGGNALTRRPQMREIRTCAGALDPDQQM